jgi:hypothetical protein
VVFFHSSSGEERTKRVHPKTGKVFCPGGTRLQRMGMRKGVPDLVVLHSGRIMGLEVKSPDGTISREQKEFRAEWERAGNCIVGRVGSDHGADRGHDSACAHKPKPERGE